MNGYTLTISDDNFISIGTSEKTDCNVLVYGMKTGSAIVRTKENMTVGVLIKSYANFLGMYGGNYSLIGTFNSSLVTVVLYQSANKFSALYCDINVEDNSQGNKTSTSTPVCCVIGLSNENSRVYIDGCKLNAKLTGSNANVRAFHMQRNAQIINTIITVSNTSDTYSGTYGGYIGIGSLELRNTHITATSKNWGIHSATGLFIASSGTAILYDSQIYGIQTGIQNYGGLYIYSGYYSSPCHGGVYHSGVDENSCCYILGGTFWSNTIPNWFNANSDTNNQGSIYIGYGATAYIDGANFGGDSPDGSVMLKNAGNEYEPSYLYISNSVIDGEIRCDDGEYLFIGENVEYDGIKSYNGNSGIVERTDCNYRKSIPSISCFNRRLEDYVNDLNTQVQNICNILAEGNIEADKSEKLNTLIYKSGELYDKGKNDSYDKFWNDFQINGNRTDYRYAFRYWTDDIYKPKYPIIVANGGNMYGDSSITDTLVQIIIPDSNTINTSVVNMFSGIPLIRIPYLRIHENIRIATLFNNLAQLEYIGFQGTIASNVNLQWSNKLQHDSLLLLINCLKDISNDKDTNYTLSIGETNLGKLSDEEIAMIINKGWSLQ